MPLKLLMQILAMPRNAAINKSLAVPPLNIFCDAWFCACIVPHHYNTSSPARHWYHISRLLYGAYRWKYRRVKESRMWPDDAVPRPFHARYITSAIAVAHIAPIRQLVHAISWNAFAWHHTASCPRLLECQLRSIPRLLIIRARRTKSFAQ